MSMSCLDCHDYMNGYNQGKKEGTIEELENIKSEIIKDRDFLDISSASDFNICIKRIEKRIEELKK